MELPNLINQIELLTQELTALQPLATEQQENLDKKFRLEFNYNSNHIEGNTLTYGETVLYLIFDKTTGDHEGREYEEMKASDVALKLVQELAAEKERPLTEAFIKNLNEIILVRPYWANAITPDGQNTRRKISIGDYKKHPNSVLLQNGEMFHYASPDETPAAMGDLIKWYREETEKKELHPIAIAALMHYKFVRIHPFDDGNGRISRLLMNYVLYNNNLPPVIIKSAGKKDYLLALNKADSGDINAFVEYVARQLIWSLELSIKAAKGESIEEGDDIDKEVALWKKELTNKSLTTTNPISAEDVRKFYIQNIGRFLIKFDERLNKLFRELFIGWEVIGLVNRTTHFHIGFDIAGTFPPPWRIESISLNAKMSGFKTNQQHNLSLDIKLEVFFNADNYQTKVTTPYGTISYPENGKSYNTVLTKEEQETIINNTVKYIFKYIKDHTEI
jgi:cell filamentation protein, protein adenylyltransferase